MKASAILISGCQDLESSLIPVGLENSLFTYHLLKVWNDGKYQGNYKNFCDVIKNNLPSNQQPNYFTTGVKNINFENQRPFTI